jgi:8-oxo-dGTP pyrophosphatase MutT (NUDIX family)
MTEITRHFTATTFIVHDGKVLLHLHPKQQLWLPPGGHIERDELPHDAARREVEEETGLRIRLHSESEAEALSDVMQCAVVPQPVFILVEDINPFHQHVDFIYFARLPSGPPPAVTEGFEWAGLDDLQTRDHVPGNVREGARRAIDYYRYVAHTADTLQ